MPKRSQANRGFYELLGLRAEPRRDEAFRASLSCYESNMFVAFERARLLVDSEGQPLVGKDLDNGGAPKLNLTELHEQMGDDLFFWPPFWHRLVGITSLSRNPHYTSGPRRYRKTLEDTFPDLDKASIDFLVNTNTAKSARERSDLDRKEAGDFFKYLISRAGVRKRTSEVLSNLREDYPGIPKGKRRAWLEQKAQEYGYDFKILERRIRPSGRAKKKT